MTDETRRPKVGVAVAICREPDLVLMARRLTNHGHGHFAFPGGHLEYGESFVACAKREVAEECGSELLITHPTLWMPVNCVHCDEGVHYVTILMAARRLSGEPVRAEPDKAEDWGWYKWPRDSWAFAELPQPLMLGIQVAASNGSNPFDVL